MIRLLRITTESHRLVVIAVRCFDDERMKMGAKIKRF